MILIRRLSGPARREWPPDTRDARRPAAGTTAAGAGWIRLKTGNRRLIQRKILGLQNLRGPFRGRSIPALADLDGAVDDDVADAGNIAAGDGAQGVIRDRAHGSVHDHQVGFLAYGDHSELPQLAAFSQLTHLRVEGVFTHFSVADSRREDDERYTALQYARFCDALAALDSYGIRPTLRHCANSAVTILHPEYSLDMVRGGIALYGCAPDVDCEGLLDLRPVMTLRTTIAQIRDVAAGTPISYGRTFTAPRDLRMAVLPIGYADGLSRGLSGKVSFRLRGQDVPVIGRICMDMCMVDITSVSDAKVGDELTLFGYDEDGVRVPVERLAQASGTISYEILCTLSKRIARLYYSGGRQSEILQYIV